MSRSARLVIGAQACYYIVTGLWPFASLQTFETVTGPKADVWLVHTVGLLLVAIGAALVVAIRSREPNPSSCVLAFGSALALCTIEIFYVTQDVIGNIYLLDAAVELALAFALAWTLWRARVIS